MIELRGVSVNSGGKDILRDAMLRIAPRESLCITGKNATGKTTILSLLIGFHRPLSGMVLIDGVDLQSLPSPIVQLYRRRVGMMYQDRKVIDTLTVFENIAIPLEEHGASDQEIRECIAPLLHSLGLEGAAARPGSLLSQTEKTLTAFARAVVHEPMVLLLDEPLEHLDPPRRDVILHHVRALQKKGTTVIVATRDTTLAKELNARLVRIGEGRLIEGEAPYEEPEQPIETPAEPVMEQSEQAQPETMVAEADQPKTRKIRITMIKG